MIHAREDYNRIQDPLGKIPVEEPVFLLRGQDAFAPEVLRLWADCADENSRPELAQMALDHADRMERWPITKTPDLPGDSS